MKQLGLFFLLLATSSLSFCQEFETTLSAQITKATVFLQGAQITMNGSSTIKEGKTTIVIKGLSPNIDKNSIQVGGSGLFTILQVNHQNNYIDTLSQSKKVELLKSQIKDLSFKIKDEENQLEIIDQKRSFLTDNRKVMGEKQPSTSELYKSIHDVYYLEIQQLILQKETHSRTINDLRELKQKYDLQLNTISGKSVTPTGEITLTIESKMEQLAKFEITYYVSNAGWTPMYDIRVDEIGKPITLICRANIYQSTGNDWKNVRISLSNANPNQTGTIPVLNPATVSFFTPRLKESYIADQTQYSIQSEEKQEVSAPAQVRIRGMATMNSTEPLYVVDGQVQQSNPNINPSNIKSINVLKDASAVKIYGSRGVGGVIVITTKNNLGSYVTDSQSGGNQQSICEYKLGSPYSIPNDGNINAVELQTVNLPASYEYQCVPKKDKSAFLIARVTDWEKFNLLSGEVNLFYENMYVGKTLLDVSSISDTLELSLGRDKGISVDRQKTVEFTNKNFIGFNKVVTRSWEIGVKNNKSQNISLKILDQMPISSNNEIEVEKQELMGGELNKNTGIVTWKMNLASQDSKKITFSYTIKHPKDKQIIIE